MYNDRCSYIYKYPIKNWTKGQLFGDRAAWRCTTPSAYWYIRFGRIIYIVFLVLISSPEMCLLHCQEGQMCHLLYWLYWSQGKLFTSGVRIVGVCMEISGVIFACKTNGIGSVWWEKKSVSVLCGHHLFFEPVHNAQTTVSRFEPARGIGSLCSQ